MELTIGITTSPRARRYLAATVDGLLAASGGLDVRVLIQPCFRDPGEDWALLDRRGCVVLPPLWDQTLEDKAREVAWEGDPHGSEWRHRGLQLNSDLLIRRLLEVGGRWFVTMQDDLSFCRRAVARIAAVPWALDKRLNRSGERVGLISFYSPYERFSRSSRALALYPDATFYGDLCLLWRRSAAEEFLGQSRPSEAHDLEISRVFANNPRWQIWAHCPCLVQHAGLEASARGASNGGQRTTMNFRAEHDAVQDGKLLR